MTFNHSHADCPHADITYDETPLVVACLYFCVFPVALFLNGGAAWICARLRSTSSFTVYLKHLVANDLLMTLTVPFVAAGNLPRPGVGLKAFGCRFSDVLFYTCLYTSICLMGLISLDRFFKIVRPGGRSIGQSAAFSHVMAGCVWVTLFAGTAIPTVVLTDRKPGNATQENLCMAMKGPAGLRLHEGVVMFVDILFWFVSIVVVVCYTCITKTIVDSFRKSGSTNGRGNRKTKLRVFLVLLVFFVCFMPLHLMRIPFSLHETGQSACPQRWLKVAYDVALWLSSTNVCLDPLLYVFLCKEFRAKVVVMMRGKASPPKSQLEIGQIASK